MNTPDNDFGALMRKVAAGDEAAARKLIAEYTPNLCKVIRKRLAHRLRARFDSLDFTQDVWASFFAQDPERRSFNSPEALVALLTAMARNKVADGFRGGFQREKTDVTREQSMDDSHRFDKHRLMGNDRTPSQILMSREEWTEFLRTQPKVYRRIFVLLREGKKQEQIAAELDIHKRTVQRAIRTVLSKAPR